MDIDLNKGSKVSTGNIVQYVIENNMVNRGLEYNFLYTMIDNELHDVFDIYNMFDKNKIKNGYIIKIFLDKDPVYMIEVKYNGLIFKEKIGKEFEIFRTIMMKLKSKIKTAHSICLN